MVQHRSYASRASPHSKASSLPAKFTKLVLTRIQWMGLLPSAQTPATQVKFFKVDAQSYDPKTGNFVNLFSTDY
jgi:hypothetical protein